MATAIAPTFPSALMLHQKMEQVEKLGTETEQSRFLVANKGNVKDRDQAIANYLQWRQEYLPRARALSESSPAASRWFGFIEDKQHKPLRSKTNPESRLVLACGGYHLCGSGCGDEEEVPCETTIAAMSNFIDNSLDRDSDEKITLLVDVRPKQGWPNPSPRSLLPLIKGLSKVFGANNPERLEACVIYPMPWYVMAIWYVVRAFLDPKTATKIVFLAGSSYENAPTPEGLSSYIDGDPTMASFIGNGGGVPCHTRRMSLSLSSIGTEDYEVEGEEVEEVVEEEEEEVEEVVVVVEEEEKQSRDSEETDVVVEDVVCGKKFKIVSV